MARLEKSRNNVHASHLLQNSPVPGGTSRLTDQKLFIGLASCKKPLMIFAQAISVLPALLMLPAAAEMFGDDYKPCGDKPSTPEILVCVKAKERIWDKRLNAAYADLRQRVPDRNQLVEAERAWVRFREANCLFYGSVPGSIHQIQAAECFRSMTQDRAVELEKVLKLGD